MVRTGILHLPPKWCCFAQKVFTLPITICNIKQHCQMLIILRKESPSASFHCYLCTPLTTFPRRNCQCVRCTCCIGAVLLKTEVRILPPLDQNGRPKWQTVIFWFYAARSLAEAYLLWRFRAYLVACTRQPFSTPFYLYRNWACFRLPPNCKNLNVSPSLKKLLKLIQH